MGSSVTSPSLVVHSSRSSLCAQKCPDMTAELSRAAHPHTTSDTHTHTHTHEVYAHTVHTQHTQTCMHIQCAQTQLHTRNVCTHVHAHSTYMCLHTHAHRPTYMHTIYTGMYTQTPTHLVYTCTHMHVHTDTLMHAHTICTHTYTGVCSKAYTHLYIHAHIHTCAPGLGSFQSAGPAERANCSWKAVPSRLVSSEPQLSLETTGGHGPGFRCLFRSPVGWVGLPQHMEQDPFECVHLIHEETPLLMER
jgi:hypothetical protein